MSEIKCFDKIVLIEYIDQIELLHLIQHREPILMLDSVSRVCLSNLLEESYAVALKFVGYEDRCFKGHFDKIPIMPGIFLLEAMSQISSVLSTLLLNYDIIRESKTLNIKKHKDEVLYLAQIEKARFFFPVCPNNKIEIESKILSQKAGFHEFQAKCIVRNKVAASAKIIGKYVA